MKILFVVHSFPPIEHSGTPLIAAQYAHQAKLGGHEVAVGAPLTSEQLSLCRESSEVEISFFSLPKSQGYWPLDESNIKESRSLETATIDLDFNPDVIHILDWVHCSRSIWQILKAKSSPIIRQIWNFEDVCSRISPCFKNSEMTPCMPPLSHKVCAECVVDNLLIKMPREVKVGKAISMLTHYRNRSVEEYSKKVSGKWTSLAEIDSATDLMIFPTETFSEYYRSHRSNALPPSIVVHHGIKLSTKPESFPRNEGDPVRFLFLGRAEARKGWPLIEDAFLNLARTHPGKFRLLAYGLSDEQIISSPLRHVEGAELFTPYRHKNLEQILQGADVGLVPSAFETFNRACREMLSAGVPVIASRAFGIPDVVKHNTNGLVLDSLGSDQLRSAIVNLIENRDTLQHLTKGARTTQIRSAEQEFREFEEIYKNLAKNRLQAS